ncbi:hypothetical protein [Microbacterium sp. ProA8]|jgi:hypothetical protein
MTFDANDVGTGIGGICRKSLTWDQLHDAAASLAVAAGDGAA